MIPLVLRDLYHCEDRGWATSFLSPELRDPPGRALGGMVRPPRPRLREDAAPVCVRVGATRPRFDGPASVLDCIALKPPADPL